MTDPSALDSAALERRYRRLLTCYPTTYRAEYGEEMIGVLLASTPADQNRPTKAAALDLIGGGLRAWFRLLRTGDGDSPWRNTLAVFSVIAPVLVFVTVAGGYVIAIVQGTEDDLLSYYRTADQMMIVTAVALTATVICPLLARRGRAAARASTAIAVVAVAAVAIAFFRVLADRGAYVWLDYLTAMLLIEVVAVIASPGPARGWQLLGRGGVALMFATAAVLACSAGLHLAGLAQSGDGAPSLWNLANAVDETTPIVGVALIAFTLRRKAGGRLLALFAIPFYLLAGVDLVTRALTYIYPQYWRSDSLIAAIDYVPVLAIAALVAAAAWRSNRRNRLRVPGATG
jgi:hypothetical protein